MAKLNGRVGGSSLLSSKRGAARVGGSSVAFGIPRVVSVPSYAFQNLTDNFTTLDLASKWVNSYGVVNLNAGRARVECSTGYSSLWSASAWSLNNSSIYARLIPAPINGGTTVIASQMNIVDSDVAGGSTNLDFYIDLGTNMISFSENVDYNDAGRVTITYDATAHAWLRLRHSAGTVYWETAPDGVTWTVRRSKAEPAWITKTNQAITFTAHRDTGTTNYMEVDNVNVLS